MNISTIFILIIHQYNQAIKYKEMINIISYAPLWKTLEMKNISQYHLLKSGFRRFKEKQKYNFANRRKIMQYH